ncbi:MAG: hypothetical protein HY246_10540, partial [Proteobacteria bacterium]|nr:hypothetical protein [Pseudomonadota bacterium]
MRRFALAGLIALTLHIPLTAQAQPAPAAGGMPTSELLTWIAIGAVVAATIWYTWPVAGAGEVAAAGGGAAAGGAGQAAAAGGAGAAEAAAAGGGAA